MSFPSSQICLQLLLGIKILPVLRDTILRFPIHSVNKTSQRDLDLPAVILFSTRRLHSRPACAHLPRPLSQSPVPWFQKKKNRMLCPMMRLHPRHTRLFPFLEMQSESARAAVTMRLSVCITAPGPAVQKATVPLIISMPTSSCSATGVNELRLVRFTAFFSD
jgi:hypothetical protein